jgi:hypothetical protein
MSNALLERGREQMSLQMSSKRDTSRYASKVTKNGTIEIYLVRYVGPRLTLIFFGALFRTASSWQYCFYY